MKLWESIDDMGRDIEHRGLKIRQMSHDLLFRGLTGDDGSLLHMQSIEPYNIDTVDNKILTDIVMECIRVRRTYRETK